MLETSLLQQNVASLQRRLELLKEGFQYEEKRERHQSLCEELERPETWGDPERSRDIGRERAMLERLLSTLDQLAGDVGDAMELLEMAVEENEEESLRALEREWKELEGRVEKLEFQRMFSRAEDPCNAWLDINAGSGGTEAQDWAEMLLRMYLRWCERRGFTAELSEVSAGEVAGIKSATVRVIGEYAYGWLRTETGVHRLVRKSPFDSGHRRHTSFAAVFISPEVDDDIEVEIQASELRVDTYRASGAGGQHVNKTDSAVRITHLPSGVVVQCQNQRSQHQNRDRAMRQLRARLYELELRRRNAEKQQMEESKSEIGWGSQIRSYVLDDSRVKDLRTRVETSNCNAVLDGEIDDFIEAGLRAGV